jgi:hypothetical protein
MWKAWMPKPVPISEPITGASKTHFQFFRVQDQADRTKDHGDLKPHGGQIELVAGQSNPFQFLLIWFGADDPALGVIHLKHLMTEAKGFRAEADLALLQVVASLIARRGCVAALVPTLPRVGPVE